MREVQRLDASRPGWTYPHTSAGLLERSSGFDNYSWSVCDEESRLQQTFVDQLRIRLRLCRATPAAARARHKQHALHPLHRSRQATHPPRHNRGRSTAEPHRLPCLRPRPLRPPSMAITTLKARHRASRGRMSRFRALTLQCRRPHRRSSRPLSHTIGGTGANAASASASASCARATRTGAWKGTTYSRESPAFRDNRFDAPPDNSRGLACFTEKRISMSSRPALDRQFGCQAPR